MHGFTMAIVPSDSQGVMMVLAKPFKAGCTAAIDARDATDDGKGVCWGPAVVPTQANPDK